MDFYNGYSPEERARKLKMLHKEYPKRSHPYFAGPCHMCGDPDSPVAPHGEDYSEPYHWLRPAVYAVCRTCHARLHRRFRSPHAWEAYKRHLRRGGYGADLRSPKMARELTRLAKALAQGNAFDLSPLRSASTNEAWWESLTVDPESLTANWARVR